MGVAAGISKRRIRGGDNLILRSGWDFVFDHQREREKERVVIDPCNTFSFRRGNGESFRCVFYARTRFLLFCLCCFIDVSRLRG